LKIDTALYNIEKSNPALKGALPDNYYSRLHIDTAKLASLLDEINRMNTDDEENDIIGRVYEYFLSKFALAEGKGKGEFYTPKSIVNLIAEMIEPYDGVLYDPCCGSGGMFVQSIKFVEAHSGNKKKVSIYGQEYTNTTFKLAKMNLAIRGISANLGEMAANTFSNDQHKDLKADFIMANPPFNQKEWRAENELIDDPRWNGYEVPPTSNANYGWILNIVSKLSQNGVAGFLLANGALSDDGTELKIRKLDMAKKEHRQMLIDVFINAIFLYDDKMLITFNYKEGTNTITFDDVKNEVSEEASGSDLDCSSAPKSRPPRRGERDFCVGGGLRECTSAKRGVGDRRACFLSYLW